MGKYQFLKGQKKRETVILLHGLARTGSSFSKLANELVKQGYDVVNCTYPSRHFCVEELAMTTIKEALDVCAGTEKIHFVTHSMGGILIRYYLNRKRIIELGRVVMLGPPNKGSQVVDRLRRTPGFKLINGPAGLQLGTQASDLPNQLGSVNYELGVIAGTKTINFILSSMLPKPNDGKVSVENTKIEGMRGHITLPVTHPFMMKNKTVIKQTLHYLEYGRFE